MIRQLLIEKSFISRKINKKYSPLNLTEVYYVATLIDISEMLITSFVTCRLDDFNCLYADVPSHLLEIL